VTFKPDRATSALGRGLDALIPQRATPATAIVEVALARVQPNPFQPRRHIDEAQLEELAASIREHGVLQPVLVTETIVGYQLIAGERRVRAARLAGLDRIPAVVRQLADRDQLQQGQNPGNFQASPDHFQQGQKTADQFPFVTDETVGDAKGHDGPAFVIATSEDGLNQGTVALDVRSHDQYIPGLKSGIGFEQRQKPVMQNFQLPHGAVTAM